MAALLQASRPTSGTYNRHLNSRMPQLVEFPSKVQGPSYVAEYIRMEGRFNHLRRSYFYGNPSAQVQRSSWQTLTAYSDLIWDCTSSILQEEPNRRY